jgi:arylsulfatase A-like enzyme
MKSVPFPLFLLLSVSLYLCVSSAVAAEKPNVVFLLCDNLGYGDVGPFGNTVHRTPNLDRMAAEGRKFTHYYSASGVCSPSRAALMTGCYPLRIGLHCGDNNSAVIQPLNHLGIAADEFTVAELLQSQGYATKAIGKWHLGDQAEFLPTRHGFSEYLGIPYSEDMVGGKRPGWPPLPLLQNEQVIDAPVDRDTLTRRYTQEAVSFIKQHAEQPFFLYFPHAVPGSEATSFASEAFRGRSQNGRYGDAVEEMDASVGEILRTLDELKLAERTLVVWTSDNGAVKREPRQGTNAPLRGWGYSTDEGGMRVPLIARWPTRVPAGTECAELTTMMDWLPTLAALIEYQLDAGRPIDGRNIAPLLFAVPDAKSPHTAFYYYQRNQLQAVRAGRWKLYLPLTDYVKNASPEKTPRPMSLFDLAVDIDEQHDLSAAQPEKVAELTRLAEAARAEIGDGSRVGRGVRKPGWVEQPVPQVKR